MSVDTDNNRTEIRDENGQLRLHAGFAYHVRPDGRVAVSSMTQRKRLLLSKPPVDSVMTALAILTQGVSLHRAVDELALRSNLSKKAAESLIDGLDRQGALVRQASERRTEEETYLRDGDKLYDRQVRFLRLFESNAHTGLELNRRMQSCTVAVVGVGGLGGWIALHCARLGVKRLVAVDPDVVELSNLHRQALYGRGDIGRLKIDACRDAVRHANPDVAFNGHPIWVHTSRDLVGILEGVDLVFNPFAYVPTLDPTAQAVAGAALEANVASMAVAVVMVGPLTVPGKTACYWCASETLESELDLSEMVKAATPGATRGEPWPYLPAMPPRQAVAGSIAAWEGLRYTSGFDYARTLDGVCTIDLFGYEEHMFVKTPRRPDCAHCGRR